MISLRLIDDKTLMSKIAMANEKMTVDDGLSSRPKTQKAKSGSNSSWLQLAMSYRMIGDECDSYLIYI